MLNDEVEEVAVDVEIAVIAETAVDNKEIISVSVT
jgi:hypothetical protein